MTRTIRLLRLATLVSRVACLLLVVLAAGSFLIPIAFVDIDEEFAASGELLKSSHNYVAVSSGSFSLGNNFQATFEWMGFTLDNPSKLINPTYRSHREFRIGYSAAEESGCSFVRENPLGIGSWQTIMMRGRCSNGYAISMLVPILLAAILPTAQYLRRQSRLRAARQRGFKVELAKSA